MYLHTVQTGLQFRVQSFNKRPRVHTDPYRRSDLTQDLALTYADLQIPLCSDFSHSALINSILVISILFPVFVFTSLESYPNIKYEHP